MLRFKILGNFEDNETFQLAKRFGNAENPVPLG